MNAIINYFTTIFSEIVSILDTLKLPGSMSLLRYFLIAILIGIVFKLVKGGSSEFEQNTNFLNSRIISSVAANYSISNSNRKMQLVEQNALTTSVPIGPISQEIKVRKSIDKINNTSTSDLVNRWSSKGVNNYFIEQALSDRDDILF